MNIKLALLALAIYLVGTVAIGLPIAKFILRKWKSSGYNLPRWFNSILLVNLPDPSTFITAAVDKSYRESANKQSASFIVMMMQLWPFQIVCALIFGAVSVISAALSSCYRWAVRAVAACDVCVKID